MHCKAQIIIINNSIICSCVLDELRSCVPSSVLSMWFVLRNSWPSDQSDSIPDIPGKILLPGPRKSTKVTRPSLAIGEGVVWGRD